MKLIARLPALLFLATPSLLAAQAAATGPYPRPAGTHPVEIERGVMVAVRDGTHLATDIYRPKDLDGPLPTVLIRTPYNKSASPNGDASANFFASHGYAVVVQDVRGKFASEGTFRVYEGEMTDWSDVFDWIGKQQWSTGKIGTYGCSYLGEGQIVAAQQRHPLHTAAIAQAAGGNLGRVAGQREFWGSVEGGTSALSINFGWMPIYASLDKGARAKPAVDIGTFLKTLPLIDMTDRAGSPSWDWRNFLERSPDDPWWGRPRLPHGQGTDQHANAAHVVVVRHGGQCAGGARDLQEERHERQRADRPVRHHLTHGPLFIRARRQSGDGLVRCQSVTCPVPLFRDVISPGSIGGCVRQRTRPRFAAALSSITSSVPERVAPLRDSVASASGDARDDLVFPQWWRRQHAHR